MNAESWRDRLDDIEDIDDNAARDRLTEMAGDWSSCAVGECLGLGMLDHDAAEKTINAHPKADALIEAGMLFDKYVALWEYSKAKQTLAQIEKLAN